MALDIIGPIDVVVLRKRYLLAMVDYHSHWISHKFVNDVTTKILIDFLLDTFNAEGIPAVIVTDNGVQFTSNDIIIS